jgi:hypothetical protein
MISVEASDGPERQGSVFYALITIATAIAFVVQNQPPVHVDQVRTDWVEIPHPRQHPA